MYDFSLPFVFSNPKDENWRLMGGRGETKTTNQSASHTLHQVMNPPFKFFQHVPRDRMLDLRLEQPSERVKPFIASNLLRCDVSFPF